MLRLKKHSGTEQLDGLKRTMRRSSGLERGAGGWMRRGEGGELQSYFE